MKRICVLSPGFTSPNGAAFLFPLVKFKNSLRDHGILINVMDTLDDRVTQFDAVMVDSKYFKSHWSVDFEGTLDRIMALGQNTKLIWCDQADSTGTFLGQVLPYVHQYLKAQHLVNRSEYKSTHYASRMYTDYYHRRYGIVDNDPYIDQPVKNDIDINKIGVSWNSGLMNYGLIGPYLPRLRAHVPLDAMLHFSGRRQAAHKTRIHDVTCRMGISYRRETACYQRKKIRKILSDFIKTDKLSRAAYLREIGNSKVCVSPFGLGEITLKDFECFLGGSLLLKPDMKHMTTWPNFYQENQTCLFHDWDMKNLKEKIDWALSHEKERVEMAQAAQDLYLRHTIGKSAGNIFAQHLKSILAI